MKKNREILVTQPSLPDLKEFIPYLERIWESKWLTNNGQFHQQLEKELAEFLGVKYVSLFANGTLALLTALQTLRISGEVITTPYSFVATTNALWWNNLTPVFVDIDPNYHNIDPEKIEAAITPNTSAILPVHVYGNTANVERIQEIADTYGLKVIYDAAHAFGVKYKGQSILNFGDLSILSFHATKVFNTFEGGAIISHDEKTKKRIDYLKNFGFADETTVTAPGINSKMNEVQAAFGLLQLKDFTKNIIKRKNIAIRYNNAFQNINGIDLFKEFHDIEDYNYAYYPIFIDKEKYGKSRDDTFLILKKSSIFARRYFYPLISNFPIYQGLKSSTMENLPIANLYAEKVICLPIYPNLSDIDIERIIKIIKD